MYISLGSHSNPVAGSICWEADSVISGLAVRIFIMKYSWDQHPGKREKKAGWGRKSWSVMPALSQFRRLRRHSWSWKVMLKICPELSQEGWVCPIPEWGCFVFDDGQGILGMDTLQIVRRFAEGNGNWRASTNCPPSGWSQSFTTGRSGCCATPLAQEFLS